MLKRKNLVTGVGMLALVAVMISGVALYAGTGKSSAQATTQSGATADVQEPSYGASIAVAQDAGAQNLAGLARITASDAEKSALAQFSGSTVLNTELDNENGSLVYSVELQTSTGVYDVKVDAGNGEILHVDQGADSGGSVGGEESAGKSEAAEG